MEDAVVDGTVAVVETIQSDNFDRCGWLEPSFLARARAPQNSLSSMGDEDELPCSVVIGKVNRLDLLDPRLLLQQGMQFNGGIHVVAEPLPLGAAGAVLSWRCDSYDVSAGLHVDAGGQWTAALTDDHFSKVIHDDSYGPEKCRVDFDITIGGAVHAAHHLKPS